MWTWLKVILKINLCDVSVCLHISTTNIMVYLMYVEGLLVNILSFQLNLFSMYSVDDCWLWKCVSTCILCQGTNKQSQLDIENEAENRGMQLFATAKREHFGVFAKCLPQDVPKGLWLSWLL